jgi:hypothetical protein
MLTDLASAALERNVLPFPNVQSIPTTSFLPPPRAIASPAASVMSPVGQSSHPAFGPPPIPSPNHARSWDAHSPGTAGYNESASSSRPHSAVHEYHGFSRHTDLNPNLGYFLDSNNRFLQAPMVVSRDWTQSSQTERRASQLSPVTPSTPPVPPIYKILPRAYAGCALDNLMLDFLRDSQRRLSRSVDISSVAEELGPQEPNYNVLMDPDTRFKPHQLSRLFTDIVRTFPDIQLIPEQVAVVYIMFIFMRWQLHPTKENYDRLPDWIRPVHVQILQPHPHWIDYIPWPKIRTLAAQDPVDINIFFVPYTTTLSLNWPYPPESVFMSRSSLAGNLSTSTHPSPDDGNAMLSPHGTASNPNMSPGVNVQTPRPMGPTEAESGAHAYHTPQSQAAHQGGYRGHDRSHSQHSHSRHSSIGASSSGHKLDLEEPLVINPVFKEHLLNLDNWSLGEAFAREFPQWRGTFRLQD